MEKDCKNGLSKDQKESEGHNLDNLYNNNKERGNWQIIYPNRIINSFNNEQLYYFLNEMFKDKTFQYDFYIRDSYYGQNNYDIRLVYEFLKLKFNEV